MAREMGRIRHAEAYPPASVGRLLDHTCALVVVGGEEAMVAAPSLSHSLSGRRIRRHAGGLLSQS
eukprot:7379920-Prymnesium_polylepis.2